MPSQYGNTSNQTGEVEQENERVFLIGVNILSHTEWKSFRTLVKKVRENYLNPRLIACGNWNKFSEDLAKDAKRLNIQNLHAFKNSTVKSKNNFNFPGYPLHHWQNTFLNEHTPTFGGFPAYENLKKSLALSACPPNQVWVHESSFIRSPRNIEKIELPISKVEFALCRLTFDRTRPTKPIGQSEYYIKQEVAQFIRSTIKNFSLSKDPSYLVQLNVEPKYHTVQMFRKP